MKTKCNCGNSVKFILKESEGIYSIYCPLCSAFVRTIEKSYIKTCIKKYQIKVRCKI